MAYTYVMPAKHVPRGIRAFTEALDKHQMLSFVSITEAPCSSLLCRRQVLQACSATAEGEVSQWADKPPCLSGLWSLFMLAAVSKRSGRQELAQQNEGFHLFSKDYTERRSHKGVGHQEPGLGRCYYTLWWWVGAGDVTGFSILLLNGLDRFKLALLYSHTPAGMVALCGQDQEQKACPKTLDLEVISWLYPDKDKMAISCSGVGYTL